ncbi:MAG TPA: SDR family NAD(P)-dependent oxidoreductase, partial [Candidatus Binatia bacterium]
MAILGNKVALVTGGATGIGRAIAIELAKNGARVAIASRSRSRITSAVEQLRTAGFAALAVQMDVRKRSDVEAGIAAIVSEWGPLHILVNNAGVSGLSLITDPDDTKWFDIVDTNLNGLYLVTKAALRHMVDGAGRVINISSVLGKFGVPGYAAYCTTKHGMIGFSRALALEVVDRGITVNTICPGWVDTEMATLGIKESAARQGITPEEFKAQAIAAVPIKRFLQAEEVAGLVAYIASEAAAGITGQAINICGDQTM